MYLEWYYINPERNKKRVIQIFFHRMPVEKHQWFSGTTKA